ncbi:MAG: urease accessory protein UreD [Chloroflexota bacterium]
MKIGVSGHIHLSFFPEDAGTQCRILAQRPPLRVIRAFAHQTSGALVHLHNVSGGVLGGDQFQIEIDVEPGAHGVVTTTGSNRIYRHRDGYQNASQESLIRLGKDSVLEFMPDSTIPFAGSRFVQKTEISMAQGAKLFWSEILNPGREGFNERFEWNLLENEIVVRDESKPILWEKWALAGETSRFESAALFGPWSYSATFVVCDCGAADRSIGQLEAALQTVTDSFEAEDGVWGVSRLVSDGVLVRGLSRKGRQLPRKLEEIHSCARHLLLGEPLVRPRKIY